MTALTPRVERYARLQWLIRLRWLALAGVSLGAGLAAAGLVPGVNTEVVAAAVAVGVLTNLFFAWRGRQRGETDDRHVGQAVLDTGALTLVIWAAGGADCPFLVFYVFPVLLAALLGGRAALWPTGAACAVGIAFQFAAARADWLRVGTWDPIAPYDRALAVGALALTVGMAAYFATRLSDALRRQMTARQAADAMLRLAFDGLDAGVEVIEGDTITLQNHRAARLFGGRIGERWRCPGRRDGRCVAGGACDGGMPERCQFTRADDGGRGPEQIYEMLALALPEPRRMMALYVERTAEVLGQRRLMLTERLASLGRAVQGVAHELNTPLATIQTLGRDVLDAIGVGPVPAEVRADIDESARMIVDEVQRCRRITHALLGRVSQLDALPATGEAPVGAAVERAIAVVFTHARDRVQIDLGGVAGALLPLDPLVQIFVNLLQNAGDADPRGPITVTGYRGQALRIEVRDRGPGLDPEAARHLFEPFFTTKPPGRGTGLGLYTSYALARKLGGELSLTDHPEGGALATLTLPLPPAG